MRRSVRQLMRQRAHMAFMRAARGTASWTNLKLETIQTAEMQFFHVVTLE